MKKIVIAAGAACALSFGAVADEPSTIEIDGYIGGTMDYRDRGISLSDEDPAVMASLGIFHDSGFYAGLVGASVKDKQGGDGKLEAYIGYRIEGAAYIYDLSAELDSFHGDGSRYYPEFKASVARDFGLAFVRTGVSYAPDGRWILPDKDSLYLFSDIEVPVPTLPELTVIGRLGYDMRQDRSNLWDWGIGVSAFIEDLELSVMFEDSTLNDRLATGTVTFSAKLYF